VKKLTLIKSYAAPAALLASLGLMSGNAMALTVELCAGSFTKTVAGQPIIMWGYDLFDDAVCTPTVPGPEIRVPDNDASLIINLTNNLGVETSLVIPGQAMPDGSTPVFFTDANGNDRVRSFTTEASAGGSATYTWSAFKPGTYAYHSGTQPSLQSHMGLYGAAIKDAAAGEAYPGIAYTNEVVLFYSEIASALHDPTPTPARPLNYHPDYYLVNGEPFTGDIGAATIAAGSVGQPTLVRMLNMGIEQRLPVFQGLHLDVIAEDGNPYPFKRAEHTVMLTPVKTKDALVTPNGEGTHAVYDAAMGLNNAGTSPGGMLTYLAFDAATAGDVVANPDSYTTDEDVDLITIAGGTPPGVLDNDTSTAPLTASVVTNPTNGTLSLSSDGSFNYAPNQDYNGADSFVYRASDGTGTAEATVDITINPVNDAPVADPNGPYVANVGELLLLDGTGSSDVDGDPLTYSWDFDYDGVTFTEDATGATPSHTYTVVGTYTVALIVSDTLLDSAIATTTVDVVDAVNIAPVAGDDWAQTSRNEPIIIPVLVNDSDADGSLVPPVAITQVPNKGGTATPQVDGTVLYTPKKNFTGTEVFSYTIADDGGAVSNEADVTVNVLK
jgi:VCBS repeat-containing protein